MKKPTKSQIRKALKESIKHWKEMIVWVEKQVDQKTKLPDNEEMYNEIYMDWFDESCALCQLCRSPHEEGCIGCPLGQSITCCKEWKNVNDTKTWESWTVCAKIMVERLEKELAGQK